MKKKCMIYGNCQHTHLEHFLEQTAFTKYFDLIKVKDVYVKDKTFLDDDTLHSLDCFIFQHISHEFDPFFNSDNICSKLRDDCIRIAIPNFWLSAYFPQNTRHCIVRPNKKYSIAPSGLFPYGDININNLLIAGISERNIIEILKDPDFYDEKTVFSNMERTLATLESREKDFQIDIPSVPWIREELTSQAICVTVNHPTREYFAWLTDSILRFLGIYSKSAIDLQIFPFQRHIHTPIYPSVIKHLKLKFIRKNHEYVFYNEKHTFEDYVHKYVQYATGGNVAGKDTLNIDKIKNIFSGDIKLINCPQTKKNIDNIKNIFIGYEHFDKNSNIVIHGDKKFVFPANSSCKEIQGLEIKFDDLGNLVWIHGQASFNNSLIRLKSCGYIHIGNSRFANLTISNAFHHGGICFIDDGCIAGERLKINLLGNNLCTIGKDCIFADNIHIMCSDGHTLADRDRYVLNENSPVHIGNHVWIDYAATLLKGAVIPNGCQIAAATIVGERLIEENAVYAGNPARCIKKNIQWFITNPEDFK